MKHIESVNSKVQHAASRLVGRRGFPSIATAIATILLCSGCTLIPETRVREELHNPFPQLKRVAVLPFFNQSNQPNVDGRQVAEAYYAALQGVPGFEVLPVGVTEIQWRRFSAIHGEPRTGEQFQKLAQSMDVEAVVVGSVTDFDAYYPPRMALTVHWYAANEGFHTIPPGYGLPWGTEAEEKIPSRIVRDAEFELARSQLKTQTPQPVPAAEMPATTQPTDSPGHPEPQMIAPTQHQQPMEYLESVAEHQIQVPTIEAHPSTSTSKVGGEIVEFDSTSAYTPSHEMLGEGAWETGIVVDDESLTGEFITPMPANWPAPTDLIPDPPSPVPPPITVTHDPVLSHTRIYRGDDPYFTERLADYVETGDDARGTSWQGYLKRSEDFVRFCCYLHITEMLEARGGRDPSNLILRWPVSRY